MRPVHWKTLPVVASVVLLLFAAERSYSASFEFLEPSGTVSGEETVKVRITTDEGEKLLEQPDAEPPGLEERENYGGHVTPWGTAFEEEMQESDNPSEPDVWVCSWRTWEGHNNTRELRVKATFVQVDEEGEPDGPEYDLYSDPYPLTVKNITVSVSTAPELLKWDPDHPERNVLDFSYSLAQGGPSSAGVQVKIHDLWGGLVRRDTLIQTAPGSYDYEWDGDAQEEPEEEDPGDTFPAAQGLYPLSVFTERDEDWYDDSASEVLDASISKVTLLSWSGQTGQVNVRLEFNLTADASDSWVRVFDPHLDLVHGEMIGPRSAGTHTRDIQFYINTERMGPYRFVLFAKDTQADATLADKEHRIKLAVPRGNYKYLAPKARNNDAGGGGVFDIGYVAEYWEEHLADDTTYEASYAYDLGSQAVWDMMANDTVAVVQLTGHGNAGRIRCKDTGGQVERLADTVGTVGREDGYEYIADHSSAALDQLLIVAFVGCYTANTEPPAEGGHGNLILGSVCKGADCAIGFQGQVYYPGPGYAWACEFWERLAQGYTVAAALHFAKEAVEACYGGDPKGFDTYDVAGADDTQLIPAGFGQ